MPTNRIYRVLTYSGTRNLGDAIQTVALCGLLPRTVGVFRDRMGDRRWAGVPFVVNGYLRDRPPADDPPCLFAGVHVGREADPCAFAAWFAGSTYGAVGARDPYTAEALRSRGVRGQVVGCATLTLEPYAGPRSGVVSADVPGGPGMSVTHGIQVGMSWAEQWRLALDALDLYRRAELVYTSRLHVALPCLAFGTPVWIRNPVRGTPSAQPQRFSLLEEMHVPYERVVTRDISPWRERYTRFLSDHLGIAVRAGPPVAPLMAAPPRRSNCAGSDSHR